MPRGTTPAAFFASLPADRLRRYIDAEMSPVVDAVIGGSVDALARFVEASTDLRATLADPHGRRLVLSDIDPSRHAEIAQRTGRPWGSGAPWSTPEVIDLAAFFGFDDEPPAKAVEPVRKIAAEFGLFPHQRDAVRRLKALLAADGPQRAILHLPTGVGKTRTAMNVVSDTLRDHEPGVVLWIASGLELLEQAREAFEEAWFRLGNRPVQVAAMWGKSNFDPDALADGFLLVGAAKAAARSRRDPDWIKRLRDRVHLLVFDEAHQSVAPTWKALVNGFTYSQTCALLGLTATPGRTWNDIDKDAELADLYDRRKVSLEFPNEPNPVRYLTANGYLAEVKFESMLAEPGLHFDDDTLAGLDGVDYPPSVIEQLVLSERYMLATRAAIDRLLSAGHRRVMVFAASVHQARVIAGLLAASGSWARVVTGETATSRREASIRTFKDEAPQPRVLVNYGVLTTGFDAPKVSGAVIARPTKSLVLYSQIVGRAIRGPKAGGTETCTVLTVIDPSLPGFGAIEDAFKNWEDVWQ